MNKAQDCLKSWEISFSQSPYFELPIRFLSKSAPQFLVSLHVIFHFNYTKYDIKLIPKPDNKAMISEFYMHVFCWIQINYYFILFYSLFLFTTFARYMLHEILIQQSELKCEKKRYLENMRLKWLVPGTWFS